MGGGNLEVGARLRVITKPDPRNPGKWCVAEVKSKDSDEPGSQEVGELLPEDANPLLPDGAGGQSWSESELIPGTVTSWDPRGFGFVELEDMRRAYVHHSAFGGGHLSVGEEVSVTVLPDRINPGKLMVATMVRHEPENSAMSAEGRVAELEAEKKAAIERDDLVKAQRIKLEIQALRKEAAVGASVSGKRPRLDVDEPAESNVKRRP